MVNGAQGPDVFGLSVSEVEELDVPFDPETQPVFTPHQDVQTFTIMQDAALYINVLVGIGRLWEKLAGAARSSDSIDFYNAPFYTEFRCYYTNSGPARCCQITPPTSSSVDAGMAWNISATKISGSPVRIAVDRMLPNDAARPTRVDLQHHSAEMNETGPQNGRLLLPGDVRFAGQLCILNWLVKHLSAGSRAYVLGTLAAMGLSHCIHDVRPSEGNESIAATIRGAMARSGFEGAADFLLRSYR
jgi:hypothetical protein